MHQPAPLIILRLVAPRLVVGGPVNTIYQPGRVIARIDRSTRTDPALIAAIQEKCPPGTETIRRMMDRYKPPVVRFHRTKSVDLVDYDFAAEQVDVYVNHKLMPAIVAEHLAAHATHFVRTRIAGRKDFHGPRR